MTFVMDYVVTLLTGWYGYVTGLIALVDLIERGFGRKFTLSTQHKVWVVLALLIVAQLSAYRELSVQHKADQDVLTGLRSQPKPVDLTPKVEALERDLQATKRERDELKSRLDERQHRQTIRLKLAGLSDEGQRLWPQCAEIEFAVESEWAKTVEAFLREKLDQSYVTRFRNSSGIMLATPSHLTRITDDALRKCGYLHSRLVRLQEFIQEFR